MASGTRTSTRGRRDRRESLRRQGRDRLRVEMLEPRQVLASTLVAVGADIGAASTPLVRLVNGETGTVVAETLAFEAAFRGGVRVALADVTGDGQVEVLAASGPGRVAEIRVFEQVVAGGGTTLREIPGLRLRPFGDGYRGGADVAAGDVNADDRADIIAAASRGAGFVNVFLAPESGAPISNVPFRSFTAFAPSYLGGATVAAADLGTFSGGRTVDAATPDGRLEVVVASGSGMTPTVAAYDLSGATAARLRSFAAFTPALRTGLHVTAGQYDGDAIDDIVVSGGAGGFGTEVYDGRVGAEATARLAKFNAFAGLAGSGAAAFAAGIDRNGDGRIDGFVGTQGTPGGSAGAALVSQAGRRTSAFAALAGPQRVAAPRTSYDDFASTLSGIRYRVLTEGTGSVPTAGRTVTTQYTGWLTDGTKFDSSRDRGTPFSFTLGQGSVIKGWDEILAQMKPGERRTVIIPPNLGYGSAGSGTTIPGNATLIFDIELVSFV
jgi:peptidylprolyl isomerase